jgi:hypothetical protein
MNLKPVFKTILIMAKQNVKQDTEATEQPVGNVRTIPDGAGNPEITPGTQGEYEDGTKEPPVPTKQGSIESPDSKGDSQLDPEGESETVGKTGDGISDLEAGKPEEGSKTGALKKIADVVFLRSPNCKALYFTSDLIPFFEKSDALRHAGKLKDDNVVTVNKE